MGKVPSNRTSRGSTGLAPAPSIHRMRAILQLLSHPSLRVPPPAARKQPPPQCSAYLATPKAYAFRPPFPYLRLHRRPDSKRTALAGATGTRIPQSACALQVSAVVL